MSRYRKTFDAGCTAHVKGPSNSSYPLYTLSQCKTQGRLARKYGLNRASAIFLADILCGGER